ncbi:MAG: hypothetical protein HFH93_12535 [Lachnospiraceae bacterium]|nr:hypothetical protein [Lachnospiraceae bacterium]
MITLDYRTNNPRWGISGIVYASWERFAFALGYLANEAHYRNRNRGGLLELHFERNDAQGAWGKEGRIQYYGKEAYLASRLADWYYVKSAGNGSITCRMNSNDYMYSLVNDFGFREERYEDFTTADIFPPSVEPYSSVWAVLKDHLQKNNWDDAGIENIFRYYTEGWNE